MAAAHRARRHHRVAPRRSRGGAQQERERPNRLSAGTGRNTRPLRTMKSRQNAVSREALARLPMLDLSELRQQWRGLYKSIAPLHFSRDLLMRAVAFRMQELALGGLRPE